MEGSTDPGSAAPGGAGRRACVVVLVVVGACVNACMGAAVLVFSIGKIL